MKLKMGHFLRQLSFFQPMPFFFQAGGLKWCPQATPALCFLFPVPTETYGFYVTSASGEEGLLSCPSPICSSRVKTISPGKRNQELSS